MDFGDKMTQLGIILFAIYDKVTRCSFLIG